MSFNSLWNYERDFFDIQSNLKSCYGDLGNRRKDITDFKFNSMSKVFEEVSSLVVVYIITALCEPKMNYRELTKTFLIALSTNFSNVFGCVVVHLAQD